MNVFDKNVTSSEEKGFQYLLTCPMCNGPLQMSEHGHFHPHIAPWSCYSCKHSFWPTELTEEARALWRGEPHRDFGDTPDGLAIRIGALHDRSLAEARGTMVLPEQVKKLTAQHKELLKQQKLSEEFASKL